ncbi:14621_t:CDS:2, partial [Rhizophagus irregularis]
QSNNENNKNNSIIESSNNVKSESSSLKFDIIAKNPLIINKIFKELLQELHDIILLNIEDYTTDQLNEFIYNFLLEYDLDPKNVFEIMTNNLQPIFYYSSLIGIFYQYGIGCEVDEIKASKIFFNTVKNNQKVIVPDQFTFDISFFDIKDNKNESKAFKWYMQLANKKKLKAIYIIAKWYRDGIGTDKNLKEATTWIKKYELSKSYGKPQITLKNFLNCSDIDVSSIEPYSTSM